MLGMNNHPKTKLAVKILVLVIIAVLFFHLGVITGFKKASFYHRYNQQFSTFYRSEPNGFNRPFPKEYGNVGVVIKRDGNIVTIADIDNSEKKVKISSSTIIRHFDKNISSEVLNDDEATIVIGEADENGIIQAKLIRVLDREILDKERTERWQKEIR